MARTIWILSFLIFFSGQSQASKYIEYYCNKEYKELCKFNLRPYQCLKKFPKQRSAICNAAFAAYQKELDGYFGPCKDEKINPCLEMEPGEGGLGSCLENIIGNVSPACAKHIKIPYAKKFPDFIFDAQATCANDLKQFCSTVVYGHKRLSNCLKENIKKLTSKECKALVAQIP